MVLDKIIESRKSIRKFKSTKPDWRTIIECIDSMRFAPMAGNNFSLKIILVDDQEKIRKIAEASEQNFIEKAQYVVVVCSDKKLAKTSYEERGEKYLKQQAGAAIQNFLLKLTEEGLSTCWIGHFYDEKIKHLLRIPGEIDVEALFPIGYAFEKPKKIRKIELDDCLYFNEYKNKKMNKIPKMNV
jgi:nitroreductase